jgi:formate dehydrogenase major subunit
MKEITLTINGKKVKGREGNTVLEVCEANDIYVPTLCHLEGLTDLGACRMCVVDIEKERRPVPACTYPARDGLVVQTHNEKLEKYRRLILELMFTERNHLCAQCVASGDCELQSLAYKYQMDNARYPYSWPALPVDSVNDYLVIDPNRCILCGRCIRTCDEIVGVHTLDFGYRGWKDMVVADLNQPLGASSCISCGACFQVCPTGAIFSKKSAYKGKRPDCQEITTVCPICGIGCAIKAFVKNNTLIRIDSPEPSRHDGLLCYMGRFGPLSQEHPRVKTSMMRNTQGKVEPCPVNEAIDTVAKRLSQFKAHNGSSSIAGIASGQASSQALKAFKELITGTLGSKFLDSLDGDQYRAVIKGIGAFQDEADLKTETPLEDIFDADCIFLVGADPFTSHPVAGSYVVRAIRQNKAKLITLDSTQNILPDYTSLWLKPKHGKEASAVNNLAKSINGKQVKEAAETGISQKKLTEAVKILGKAKRSIIVYGEGVLQAKSTELITALYNVAAACNNGKPSILSLRSKGNSRAAWDMGIANSSLSVMNNLTQKGIKALYLLLADDYVEAKELSALPNGFDFLVVQTSYLSSLAQKANVVLPSPTWTEMSGDYSTLDGIPISVSPLLQPPEGVRADWETINEIAKRVK